MTRSVLEEILVRNEIIIAVAYTPPPELGYAPEFYLDPLTGEPKGVVPELGKIMARDLGVRPIFVDVPWPDHLHALLSGRVDLLMSYTNTPQRALEVEFAGPLLPSEVVVMTLTDSQVRGKEALQRPGVRIGVWHGSSIARIARQCFPHAKLLEFPEPAVALRTGEVDACVVDAVTRIFLERNPDLRLLRDKKGRVIVLAEEYGHPAIRPGDQRFLNWINAWLDYHRAQRTIDYWCGTCWRSWMAT
ncbi:MAG: ABC transporter substrate-binding protein [Candidatus Hadarchaeum sp.]